MAIESPALMNATLAWAAMHSVEFRGQIKGISDPIRLIATLKARSIGYLRRELQKPDMELEMLSLLQSELSVSARYIPEAIDLVRGVFMSREQQP
jgi:hypothetical protein